MVTDLLYPVDQHLSNDCSRMVFNTIFNIISCISRRPVHLYILFWTIFRQYSAHYFFQVTGCFPTCPSSKQCFSSEGEMNFVAMTIINPREVIGRAGDRTSNSMFSSAVHYRLRFGARNQSLEIRC